MSEQWTCRCRTLIGGRNWVGLHGPLESFCEYCKAVAPSGIPETVFGSVPVEIGDVPDMGAPVFGPLVDDEIRMSQVSDPNDWGLAPEVEEALKRRLQEGFPKVGRKG